MLRAARRNLCSRVLVPLALAALAITNAQAADPPPSPVAALERALAEQPGDAVLAYFLAVFRAREGNVEGSLEALERTLVNGAGFMPPIDRFAALKDDPRFAVLRARFERRLPVRTDGRVAFALPDRGLIPEGIAYDAQSRMFYIGSIARNTIYRVDARGRMQRFSRPTDALDAVLGLAVDRQARRLYAVSTNALTAVGREKLRNAVMVYDLDCGGLVRTIDIRDARQLNDLAVLPGGVLLVTTPRAARSGASISQALPSRRWCRSTPRAGPTESR